MDTYFGNNKFVGPPTVIKRCGRAGKGERTVNTLELSEQSQIEIIVECKHGQRQVRWNRRFQSCKQCAVEAGVYNTSPKGRVITWGDKISEAKSGIKFTEKHKGALLEIRKQKFCQRAGVALDKFIEFPSYSEGRFRICDTLRRAIIANWDFNQFQLNEQERNFFQITGYSLVDLKTRLESLFDSTMSWSNYGFDGWHVDHIVPLSWFEIQSIYDATFKECWSLSNLQPLWKEANFRKSNHYIG